MDGLSRVYHVVCEALVYAPEEDICSEREKEAYASVLNIGAIGEKRHKNIRIHGGGTIDNQGSILADQQTAIHGRMSRSHGLPVINCDYVAIDGITVQNPCTWNVHPIYCTGFTTYGCTILSDRMGLSNADGWVDVCKGWQLEEEQ